VDALSQVLAAVHMDGAVYITAEFTAPWCAEAQYGLHRVAGQLPRADHVIFFHLMTEGKCLVGLADGSETITAAAGDVLLFPHNHLHRLGSDLTQPVADVTIIRDASVESEGLVHMRYGGGGAATRFVCGYLACDRQIFRPMLDALPQMLRIPLGDASVSGWIADLLRIGVEESKAQRPGSLSLLSKLSELTFIEAMRRYVQSQSVEPKGWLAGLRDPYVGRALALLHAKPAHRWTVEELASDVALSRSALADRFVDLIGEPPMQYLTRWRLALAARSLRTGIDPIARIAERSAYDSEAAFTRAFKREFGVPPSVWRRTADVASAARA